MNRNANTDQPTEVCYSYGNLPPSVREATRRLDEVDETIARIEADLRAKTEKDLDTSDAYDDWKFRANRAQAHKQREKTFLLQWLSYEKGKLERNQEILSEQDRRDRLHAMVTEFLRSASPYGKCLDLTKSVTLEEIATRRRELTEIKMEYGAFLTFLKGESFRIHCPPDYYHSARSRVAQVVQKAEAELLCLKKLNKTLEPQSASSVAPNQKFDPRANGNPRMTSITSGLYRIKTELGMDSARMTVWLYEILRAQEHCLTLDKEQLRILGIMGEYIQLTKERLSIEFPK